MRFWPFTWGADPKIDTLIKPPVPRFVGLDEELRKRTAVRRAKAETIKAAGRLLETQDDRPSRLYAVK